MQITRSRFVLELYKITRYDEYGMITLINDLEHVAREDGISSFAHEKLFILHENGTYFYYVEEK